MPTVDRMPPQNIDAEQAVLGAMLIKKEAIAEVSQLLRPEDFYRDAHKIIYEAMLALFNRNEPADIVTVTNYLDKENKLDKVGGITFVRALANIVPTAANVNFHANIVREKADLRHLINTATDIAGMAYEATDDVADVIDKSEKMIMEVANRQNVSAFTPMQEIVMELSLIHI